MTIDLFKSVYSSVDTLNIVYLYHDTYFHKLSTRVISISIKDLELDINYWIDNLKYVEKMETFYKWVTSATVNDIYSLNEVLETYKEENIEWV